MLSKIFSRTFAVKGTKTIAVFMAISTLFGCRSTNQEDSQTKDGGISGFGNPPNFIIWESFKLSVQSYTFNDQIHFQITSHHNEPLVISRLASYHESLDGSRREISELRDIRLKAASTTHVTALKKISKLPAEIAKLSQSQRVAASVPTIMHEFHIEGFNYPGRIVSPLFMHALTPADKPVLHTPINEDWTQTAETGLWLVGVPIHSKPLKPAHEHEINLNLFEGAGDLEFSSTIESPHSNLGRVQIVDVASSTLRVEKTEEGFLVYNPQLNLGEVPSEQSGYTPTDLRVIHTVRIKIKQESSPTSLKEVSGGMAALIFRLVHSHSSQNLAFGIPVTLR